MGIIPNGLRLLILLACTGIAVALGAYIAGPGATKTVNQANSRYGPLVPLNGRRPFPDDNPWNTPIDREPADAASDVYISSIGRDKPLHPDWGPRSGIPYIVVGSNSPRTPIRFEAPDESDPGPYPIPLNSPIEGGPNSDGDRHVLALDRDNWKLYELFNAHPGSSEWRASSGAVFDLSSNKPRPLGWTSADAAGLPIFPGLARYDEAAEQKAIHHALRFTVRRTRRAFVAPARHFASRNNDPTLPPMGMRVRLKASYNLTGFTPTVRAILQGLKTYGMILADNGGDWFVTGAPDPRWNDDELNTLKRVRGSDLEVVKMGPLNK